MEVQVRVFLTSSLDTCYLSASGSGFSTVTERVPGTHRPGRWMKQRAGAHILEKNKII